MEISFNPKQYAHVNLLLWPWIWWQLFWLRGWSEATERGLIYEIAPNGKVHVLAVGDHKRDLRAWMGRQQRAPKPHLDYCDNAAGDLDVAPIVTFTGRAMARFGYFERWEWVRVVLRGLPAIEDSS